MDERRIDAIARLLAVESPRRRLMAGAGAALFGSLAAAGPALAACKKVGKKCDKNKDCCTGARCKGGRCKCKSGYANCNGKCADLEFDEKNCSRCGAVCPTGQTCCRGRCVDTASDDQNCGRCINICAPNLVCQQSQCRPLF